MKTAKVLFLLVGLSISSMGFGVEGEAVKEQVEQHLINPSRVNNKKNLQLFILQDNRKGFLDERYLTTKIAVYLMKPYLVMQRDVMNKLYALSQKPEVRDFDDFNSPVSKWPGVHEVDEKGRITKLGLSFFKLTGPIPSEIGKLTALTYLNFSDNKLTGPIPSEIGQLKALRSLDLSSNQLTGSIPSEIGELEALRYLDLSSNQLTGSIPSEIGELEALIHLDLSHNQLTNVDEFKAHPHTKIIDI